MLEPLCIVRVVKRGGLARNWTVQTQNQPIPPLTRPITSLIGLRGDYEPGQQYRLVKL